MTLQLLIRVSQVRDLYGLPNLEDFPCRGVLKRIRVSRQLGRNRHIPIPLVIHRNYPIYSDPVTVYHYLIDDFMQYEAPILKAKSI